MGWWVIAGMAQSFNDECYIKSHSSYLSYGKMPSSLIVYFFFGLNKHFKRNHSHKMSAFANLSISVYDKLLVFFIEQGQENVTNSFINYY